MIVNDSEPVVLNSDTTIAVAFNVLSPTFSQQPMNQIAIVGGSTTLASAVNGRLPMFYQWRLNSTNINRATNSSLTFTNVQFTNAGTYMLVASNAFGVSNSQPATLSVQRFIISASGQPVNGDAISVVGYTTISFQSLYAGGMIFYTLDGSLPDFNANPYTGQFTLWQSSTVRAIAYSSDFSQSVLSDPLAVTIIPTFSIYLQTPGGGTITLNPNTGAYTNGAAVTVTATPNSGWTFMGWSGDLAGTNPAATLIVNGNMNVQGQFGTSLMTTTAGSGTVSRHPFAPLYPYASSVLLSAVPNSGSYFALWGNAASGNQTPLFVSIYNPSQTVSALFASLPINQASITVLWQGGGSVAANPSTNRVPLGGTVVLTAAPLPGQQFLGWSGDASGTANPLSLLMNTNKVVTAQFSRVPSLSVTSGPGVPIQLEVDGVPGEIFCLQATTNLSTWTTLLTATNFYSYDPVWFLDPASTNLPYRMYRIVSP
jgi:hypothetical protein